MAAHHEDVHKHLDFIQLVITRMGANSFLVKGWAVTLVAALLAFTADKDKVTAGAWIGLLPAAMFWGLDAYYLRQERLFRKLYDAVRVRDTTDYSLHNPDPKHEVHGWLRTLLSATLLPFYGILIAVTVVVALQNPTSKTSEPTKPIPHAADTFTPKPQEKKINGSKSVL